MNLPFPERSDRPIAQYPNYDTFKFKRYTKAQRKSLASAFKNAQKWLWDGISKETSTWRQCEYICHAIRYNIRSYDTAELCIQVVEHRLHPHNNLISWLDCKGYKLKATTKSQQAYRLSWLKDLEKEFTDET